MNATRPWKIMTGDSRDQLRLLPEQSVDCCVTSPPLLGTPRLRREGAEGSWVVEVVAC